MMKKGIVEKVDDKYIYIILESNKRVRINKTCSVKENNVIYFENNKIVKIEEKDEQLYSEIKELERKIFKRL